MKVCIKVHICICITERYLSVSTDAGHLLAINDTILAQLRKAQQKQTFFSSAFCVLFTSVCRVLCPVPLFKCSKLCRCVGLYLCLAILFINTVACRQQFGWGLFYFTPEQNGAIWHHPACLLRNCIHFFTDLMPWNNAVLCSALFGFYVSWRLNFL
jgi:hypothetical protein